MLKKIGICIFLSVCLVSLVFATGGKEKSSSANSELEGTVSFYANITSVEPLMEDFNKKTGVKAEYTRISTTKFLSTVFTEFEAGKLLADIVQAPLPVMEQLRAGGVLAPYKSPSAAGYPDWAKREKDGIYMFGIEYVGLIYNKNLVKPEDVPKAYKDLADPKWKNKIVMADPSIHPTTISWLVALKQNVFNNDDAQWRDFLKGLAANNPMFVASFGPTPAPIASGEKAIGISMPKYIVTNAPAPLDWARIEPLMGSPRAMGISAKAPHPNAAKKFVDYWLSKDAATILARDVGEYVLAPGVFPPIDGIDKVKVIPIEELSDNELTQWAAEFKKIFGTK
ncbi:MAG: extracellular solute-binding protein [Spirochaetaceae bacterium]|nr:extracellular solute-binding protein [Spirochaetaceae bacterium]